MGFIVVRATGTPFERGRAVGRGLGDAIEHSLGFVRRYLDDHGVGPHGLDHVVAPYVAASEATVPHLVEQLRGMADGAEQSFAMLMADAASARGGRHAPAGRDQRARGRGRCDVAVCPRRARRHPARATRPGRAGGYSYQLAFPDEAPLVVETTGSRESVRAANVHTNHALDPAVAEVTFPPSVGSQSRYARAASLAASVEPTMEGVVSILADHEAQPQSICVHPDPADGDEGSTILFAMVAEPVGRSLTIASGHACTGVFETFRLDDLR